MKTPKETKGLKCEEQPFWDWQFFFKLLRNVLILGGIYLISSWAVDGMGLIKGVFVFTGFYLFSELMIRYRIKQPQKVYTLVF